MKVTIFFSWQSDTKAAANLTFIQAALEGATKEIREDSSIIVQPVIDRDTLAVTSNNQLDEIFDHDAVVL